MLTQLSVSNLRPRATKYIVLGCSFVELSILVILRFGLLQKTQAAEIILPDRQVSAAPNGIQTNLALAVCKEVTCA
jgi:hypothetical protein